MGRGQLEIKLKLQPQLIWYILATCSATLTSKTQIKMRLMTSITTSSDVMLRARLGSQFIVNNVSTSVAGTDWNKLTNSKQNY